MSSISRTVDVVRIPQWRNGIGPISRGSIATSSFDPLSLNPVLYLDWGDQATLWVDSVGGTAVSTTGDVIGATEDQSTSGNNLIATGAFRGEWNSAGFMTLDGIGNGNWVPSSSALYKYLHDGTGCTTLYAIKRSAAGTAFRTLHHTLINENEPGARFAVRNPSDYYTSLGNKSGTWALNTYLVGDYPHAGVGGVLGSTYIKGASHNYETYFDTTLTSSTAVGGTPSTIPSWYGLNMFKSPTNTSFLDGDVYAVAYFDYVLDAAQLASMVTYMKRNMP
jgi:hypothetical protein